MGSFLTAVESSGFEGRVLATVTWGAQSFDLRYTFATNQLRIERTDTNRPHARNILNRQTSHLTLLFPHNRSFVRLKDSGTHAPARVPADVSSGDFGREALPTAPGVGALPTPPAMPTPASVIGPANLPAMPAMPSSPQLPAGLPAGISPQPGGSGTGILPVGPGVSGLGQAGSLSHMPAQPMMPMMPMDMMEKAELKATGQKTNLLGYACERFELQQRGEVMEIWATDKLPPFQPWLANQPHCLGPQMIEEQWPELLKTRKLFHYGPV